MDGLEALTTILIRIQEGFSTIEKSVAKTEYLDIRQAAREFPLSVDSFQKLIERGVLPSYKVPGIRKRLLKRRDIVALINNNRCTPKGPTTAERVADKILVMVRRGGTSRNQVIATIQKEMGV